MKHIDGFVNVIVEKQTHLQRVTLWCGFWAEGIIGPHFIENKAGHAVAVTGVRYCDMITQFFLPKLVNTDEANMWFEQDGDTCHTPREIIQLLYETFSGRVLSRFGDQNQPPRSCDFRPSDFLLWGYLKSKVYINKPTTTGALQQGIKRCIIEIQPRLC